MTDILFEYDRMAVTFMIQRMHAAVGKTEAL